MNEEENQRLLEDLSEAQQDLAEQKKKTRFTTGIIYREDSPESYFKNKKHSAA